MILDNVKISTKVGLMLALPLLLAALVGGAGVKTVFDLDHSTQQLVDQTVSKARGFASASENNTRLYQLGFSVLVTPDQVTDLQKDVGVIEADYNDARGVTAEFNRNMLRVLNHELDADFDPDAFEHRAFYEPEGHRIEMHLAATRDQTVHIPGIGSVRFTAGETIRTEISCKYDRATAAAMLGDAGLALADWRTDPEGRFALALAAPRL